MHAKRQGRAFWHWYAKDDTPEERKLIVKLDLLIIPYAVVAYWIKYIDQSNLSTFASSASVVAKDSSNSIPDNAYVSGLKEDLHFKSNQLVNLNAMYTAGAVIGQLPFTFIFPMFPMNYTIPALEVGWGIFTLLQFRAQGYAELMTYRFLVGIFEASDTSEARSSFTHRHFRPPSSQECISSWALGTEAMSLVAGVVFSMSARCWELLLRA